jgi:hypothetical protein
MDSFRARRCNPKPLFWTARPNDILQKVIRANRRLSSKKNEALDYFSSAAISHKARAGP